MKRVVLLLTLLFSFLAVNAQRVIKMEPYGGVYRIPCTVNGARMKMVFDTGASSVSMSETMAQYLYDNDYITDDDLGEIGQSETADGSIVDHQKVNLRDVTIGTMHLTNVEATIMASQDAPLLLGQSALRKIGRYSIDGNNLIIYQCKDSYTEEELDSLWEEGKQASDEGNYKKAEDVLGELYYADVLNNYGKYEYAFACSQNEDYEQSLKPLKELENTEYANPETYNFSSIQVNIFYLLADSYLHVDDYKSSEFYINKAVTFFPDKMKVASGKEVSTLNSVKPIIYDWYARACKDKKLYKRAADIYWDALSLFAKYYGISEDDLWDICTGVKKRKNIDKDEELQSFAFNYAECCWLANYWSDDDFYNTLTKMGEAGNVRAKDYLK